MRSLGNVGRIVWRQLGCLSGVLMIVIERRGQANVVLFVQVHGKQQPAASSKQQVRCRGRKLGTFFGNLEPAWPGWDRCRQRFVGCLLLAAAASFPLRRVLLQLLSFCKHYPITGYLSPTSRPYYGRLTPFLTCAIATRDFGFGTEATYTRKPVIQKKPSSVFLSLFSTISPEHPAALSELGEVIG